MQAGEDCELFSVGDEVFYAGDISKAGSNAEFQLIDERIVGRKPASLPHNEAAALPLTSITAYEALFEQMAIVAQKSPENSSKSLLVIAGAGGVGSVALQFAKTIAGIGKVIATASRPETIAWCKKQGADHTINHREELLPQLKELGLAEVDYILCCAPTEQYFAAMAKIIKPQGTICSIVELTDNQSVPLNLLMTKSVRFCWEVMFTKSLFPSERTIEQHHLLNQVAAWVEQGLIRSTATEELGALSTQSLAEAHRRIASGKTIGKLVLAGIDS